MKTVVFALYAEGRTDERFLPIIIRRTVQNILIRHGELPVNVAEPTVLKLKKSKPSARAECILKAAEQASGYHALIVHADADDRMADRAMKERIQPGFDLVLKQKDKNKVCRQLAPIIPIRMTEAWMLTDIKALQDVIGTDLDARKMGVPEKSKAVESLSDPKQTLQEAVRNALANRPRRRGRISLASLYEPLAEQIRLACLESVSAYGQFTADLTNMLTALHLVKVKDSL
ncbi:MAG: hypothetical protein BWK80_22480 [Desulfobacteraceae bacterium IS3]|nr:MAG: hypothetical protein BWK80_22480 [Desulfobacteraceae bacterium IS3]